jgi:hypothetical protein
MAYVRLPDNSYFKVPEGASPEQAMQVAQQKYPKAFMSEKELESKQGFSAAVGQAFRGAKAAGYEGAGKLLDSEMLKDLSKEEYEKLEKDPSFIPTTAEDRKAAFSKGLMSGIGALGREYISEPVGGMVGRFGVPLGVGALATVAAPTLGVGALGAGVIGGAVTAAADYLPQVGENLERQRATGKPENLSDAALTAIPQAALSGLNLRLGMLPKGVQNIFKADAAALQKQVVAGTLKPEAAVAQLSSNLKNILLSTGSAAVVGTGTMVGEEALRRGQAGQSVFDAEAMGDYGDIALQAGAIAPLFGVPRGALRKGAEKRGIEAAGAKRAEQEGLELRAKQDAEAALVADDAFRAEQARTGDLFAEPIRTEGPAKGKEAFGKMEGDVSPLPGVADNLTVAERERLAQERGVETQTPFEATRQRDLLAKQVEEIETRVAKAAAEGDVDTVSALSAQVQPFRDALKKAEAEFKAAGPIELFPAQQLEKMQSDLDKGLKELKKAGDLGDFDRIAKLAPQLRELQAKIAEAGKPGPDLYAVEKDVRAKGEAETKAALEQGQLDLMAQVGKPTPRVEAKQKQVLENYQDSVRQLDEAYAANADKRIVDELVDRVIKAEADKAAQIAKTSDVLPPAQFEAAQQRVDRIKRALAEATAKGDGPSTVGLRNQLAKAIVETARTPVESRRSKALEDQMAAIETLRTAVEDARSGRFLGEGSRDTTTAESLLTGLERQANESISKYAEAAIRDVQALRERNGQKKMTVTEATRLAMDVRNHLEKAARNMNEAAFALPKGELSLDKSRKLGTAPQKGTSGIEVVSKGSMSPIERQLAQIKKKYHKGEQLARKGPEGLKVEVDTLRSRLEKGERIEGGKPFETEARREERLKEETAEAESKKRLAQDAGVENQIDLFSPKDLAPIATKRATPENFIRFLRSGTVSEFRSKIKAKEDADKAVAASAVKRAKDTSPVDQNYVAAFDRVEMLGKTADGLQKSLDDAWNAFTVARKKIEGSNKTIKIFEGEVPFDTGSPGKLFNAARAYIAKTTKQLRALKEAEAKLFRRLEEVTAEPKTNQVKLNKINDTLAQNRKEQAALISSLQKKIKEAKTLRENLKGALEGAKEKVTKGRAAQLLELETLRKELTPRIKSLLDEKLKLEKDLNADAWSRMNDKVKAATSEAGKRQANAERERIKKRGDDQIELTQRAIKEQERRAADIEKQMSAERLADLPVIKQEVVVSEFNVENAAEVARKKDLKKLLATEKEKANPDQKRVASLERQLAFIETRQPVLRKEITRGKKTAAERREASLETQKAAQAEIKERRAPTLERMSIAAAKAQESELNKQLKELRAKHGKMMAAKEKADSTVANARTEKTKANAQAKLKAIQKDLKALQFEKRERVLTKQLEDLSSVGAKVERVLEVAGNKPEREQRTKPLRVGKTIAEKYDLEKDYAQARQNGQIDDLKYTNNEDGTEVATFRGRSGTDYRAEAPVAGKRIDAALAKQVSDAIEKNAPKDVNLKSVDTYSELPASVKKLMERDGIVEGSTQSQSVRGFVTPDGDVYVIRGNHESVKDMERTYVHEIIGHAGVDRILGKDGMEALTKRMNAQGGAMELARKLGVDENVKGAMDDYALSIAKMTRDGASKETIDKALKDMETQAVRELLAYTAEKRVDENFKQKAGRWVQEVIGAIRAALRKMGFMELSKVSTADIYNILRQSQKNYNKGQLGAFRETNGNIAFRSQPIFSPNISTSEAATISKVIARDKPFKDRIKGNAIGMSMMHRFVDRFAGLEYIARNMRDKLEGVQMMYYNRLYDQRNNMIAEIATHGSVGLERNTDGSYQYKSRKGPSLKNVFEFVNRAKSEFGNAQATLDYFGTYLAMERAASNKGGLKAGLEKLDLSGKISEAEANAILKKGRANTHFQDARKAYREYNNGMIDLMVESGRLDKAQAAEMKKGDYVPYYRDRGGEIIDTENNIRVGDIKTQAYLKELIGGDSAIVNFETGALQNTYMLTDMAMSNIAAKNTAYTLSKLGMAEVKMGSGPAKANIIRFYEDGKQKHAEINTKGNYLEMEARLDKMRDAGKANTPEYKKLRERAEASRASEGAFGDIPADLIVKGMEGVASAMPAGVALMRIPADLLRKAVTRNPAYALRIALKDSLSGWVVSGADVKPVVSTFAAIKKSWKGDAPEVRALQEQGIIGGHAFAGTMSDMRTIAQQIAQGQSGWEKLWAKSDRMAMMADEAQRISLYNGFIKKGMSPMEATLATLESQNFTKHGYSPTAKALSTMIPFFNAQIQGLNAFARAMSGRSLFEDKLGVRQQMFKRGMMLAGATMAYSALMQNNEAYQNATEMDKLNYWFVPLPFMDEPVRVPIPFEAGAVFKAIPESIYNLMASDSKSKDVLPAVGRLALNSIPGMSNMFLPQGIKPAIELVTGTSFFTMEGIESARQKSELPGFRSGANTTEVSKAIGKALNVSPVQLDHAINGYTASLGIALLSMFNPLLRDADVPESKASQTPIFGGFFQPTDGVGLINKAYEDMIKIEQVNSTFKRLEERDPDEADRFLDKYLDTLDKVSAAGSFKKQMGELNKEERIIRGDKEMTAAQKREAMDEIKQIKIEIAKEFMSISRE